MVRLGRNDPCWCGSGKKYKKCHLAEDERMEREQVVAAYDGAESAPPTATAQRREEDDTAGWLDDDLLHQDLEESSDNEDVWERYESASPEEMESIYLDAVDSGKMDEELAFEMLLDIKYEVDDERFKALVDRLRIGSPAVYDAIAQDLSLWMIESAAARGKSDRIPGLLRPFVEDPAQATHVLFDVIDVLMFYGETDALLGLMKATSRAVLESEDFVLEAKRSFATNAISLVTAKHVDANGVVDTTNPAFREAVSTFLPDLGTRLDALEATAQHETQLLTVADLKRDNRKETRERIRQKLREIGIRWSNSLSREQPSLFARSLLARQEILGLQDEMLDKGKDGERLLLPKPKDLDRYLGAMLGPVEPMPHRVAAMMELLPSYLQFLVQIELLSEDQAREEVASLGAVAGTTVTVLRKLTPELAPFVENAWK